MGLFGLFSNKKKETLDKGLEKTKESVFSKLARAVAGKSTVDDDVLADLEVVLITFDNRSHIDTEACSKAETTYLYPQSVPYSMHINMKE